MDFEPYRDFKKKFRTLERDSMYQVIEDNDKTGVFKGKFSIFLAAFAIGFHRGITKSVSGKGSINHTNASSFDNDSMDLIIMLMLDRHPEIDSPEKKDQLWDLVEQYAEGGIGILFESLKLSEWVLDTKTLLS